MPVPPETTETPEQTVNKDEVNQVAIKEDIALLQQLLKKGVDLNGKVSEDNIHLHVATKAGQLEVVEFLLNQRVEVDSGNNEQVTPLHYGCKSGEENIVNAPLKGGTSIDLRDSHCPTAFQYACKGDLLKSDDTLRESRANPNNTDGTGGFEQISTH